MTNIEARLQHALEGDDPPSDPLFRIGIVERRERAEARRRLALGLVTAFGFAIVAAIGLAALDNLAPAGAAGLVAIAAAAMMFALVLTAPYLGTLAAVRNLTARLLAQGSRRLWY